ncbi:tetratricopeptide repeat protein [Sporanaerobacter sp.]|uniref:tetratricopeptide repeat protein n=1 Tax=Sporanaerobacter sp. TaxID=2010183 RepID=UPI003A0FFB70
MEIIENYFKDKAKNLAFIEIKKGSSIKVNDCIIEDYIPLPIITDVLIEEINKGKIDEEIKISHIIEGIIYTLGIDPNFKYRDKYIEILSAYSCEIKDYIFNKGMIYLTESNYELAIVYFRALINIDSKNTKGMFNYGICLEEKAKKLICTGREEEGEVFLREATKCFETILDISENYSLAYYKLGYHYKYFGQFLKAKIIWEKFLLFDNDKERKQEVREEIANIEDDSNYEEGLNLFYSGKYDRALEKFINLKIRHENWWNLEYMIGLCYKNIGNLEEAIEHFNNGIELNGDVVDLYNELGICLFSIGKFKEAIETFTIGIGKDENDYKIICNRGVVYYQLGLYDMATLDIERAYKLAPQDDMVKKIKMNLDEINRINNV